MASISGQEHQIMKNRAITGKQKLLSLTDNAKIN